MGEAVIATSIIVAAELRYGAAKKGSARLAAQLEAILAPLDVLPLKTPADAHYAAVRAALEIKGAPIGGNDLLIAAQALSQNMILATNNSREFERVEGLRLEDWLT